MPASISLDRHHPSLIPDDRVVLVCGPRGSGKSTLLADIMYYHRHIPYGVVMAGTIDTIEEWKKRVPPMFVYKGYRPDILRKILKEQEKLMLELGADNIPPVFVVLDDVAYDREINTCKVMRELLYNGRHMKIFLIIAVQYCLDMKPNMRGQFDVVYSLQEVIVANRKRLYQNFYGVFPDFSVFDPAYMQCTSGHDAMVLDKVSRRTGNPIDMVYWYGATRRGTYRVGSPEFWMFARKMFDNTKGKRLLDDSDDEQIVPRAKKQKKSAISSGVSLQKRAAPSSDGGNSGLKRQKH
jgi:hypothetical protein